MNTVEKRAEISECEQYRYELTRVWEPAATKATFVMLNPSTADASVDDPTIRRCIGFARTWGFGGIRVVNLYAYRATDPKTLRKVDDPIGPDNDRWLENAAEYAAYWDCPLIAAWGAIPDPARVWRVTHLPHFDRLKALGVTKDGHPRHPLYVKADAPLIDWGWHS
jgi:hypothetical protein